jgi:hypothetical protein
MKVEVLQRDELTYCCKDLGEVSTHLAVCEPDVKVCEARKSPQMTERPPESATSE